MAEKRLEVIVSGDIKKLRQAMKGAGSTMDRFKNRLGRVGNALTVGVTAPLAFLGNQAAETASELEQSVGAVESVFGDASEQILEFGESAAQSFGLSRREVNETAAVLGAQLQSMGFSAEDAAGEVINLEERAADMAATFGGSTKQALEAIASLMRGERDPIEKYGVAIKQADINARLAAQGLDNLTGEAKKQAEAQAGLALLMEQTAKVEGQFAQESDTAAGKTARATAKLENMRAEIGKKLLPIKMKLTDVVAGLTGWFSKLDPAGQNVALAMAGVAFAMGPVAKVGQGLITIVQGMSAAVRGLSRALIFLNAHPMVAIVTAIGLLAAGLVIAWQRSQKFREIVTKVWLGIQDVIRKSVDAVMGAIENMINFAIEAVNKLIHQINRIPKVDISTIGKVSMPKLGPRKKTVVRPGGQEVIARAHGGRFAAGDLMLVGEEGPELASFGRPGTIIPNDQLGGGLTIGEITINIQGEVDLSSPGKARQAARILGPEIVKQIRLKTGVA